MHLALQLLLQSRNGLILYGDSHRLIPWSIRQLSVINAYVLLEISKIFEENDIYDQIDKLRQFKRMMFRKDMVGTMIKCMEHKEANVYGFRLYDAMCCLENSIDALKN